MTWSHFVAEFGGNSGAPSWADEATCTRENTAVPAKIHNQRRVVRLRSAHTTITQQVRGTHFDCSHVASKRDITQATSRKHGRSGVSLKLGANIALQCPTTVAQKRDLDGPEFFWTRPNDQMFMLVPLMRTGPKFKAQPQPASIYNDYHHDLWWRLAEVAWFLLTVRPCCISPLCAGRAMMMRRA